ncbi:Multifunctional pyrimidine synthesis protein CAD [Coemansia sp. RSA 989]|nr:Multifunctional pyrimidine synthesis protein CAD [Coemansia sp. RSA 1086]KAJ1753533.1 Multifunctional pyrimidine synthesis protein CAD [Coemansia sp. RSA 1821]KAJ1862558.1 Multifunctional pyrimidine synthesis protein CAD [Coemansia sp. RSA 989]KAJ1870442.1 Multifunctional pyrimidine synthesis protein CAD [Coemansia sp. RSA 990]KAJ2651709.1 Multifunctional pyrimidine synthesis protein CAD [Coemansia sp. RSA 1250]KAJ2676683.1 Multifunctional pyrimidine synthesis protein CAD [Coemansia sp. RSA
MPILSAVSTIKAKTLVNPISVLARSFASVAGEPKPLHAHYPVVPGSLTAHLQLRTGETFTGGSFGASSSAIGETVFTTSLVGYPESMTDPSYLGQILVFTQPLIGNYGVPRRSRDQYGLLKHFESEKIQCKGIVVSDYATKYSHWNAVESLSEWCEREGIPAITGVDTRALVHILRGQGSTLGSLSVGAQPLKADKIEWSDPNQNNLVAEASTDAVRVFNPDGDVHVALIDCGVKYNIIRSLCDQGARVSLVPWNHNLAANLSSYDGIFISNGPGSPSHCHETISQLQQAFSSYQRPIFGICMGNQLMGMAAGLNAYKLRFGNRGHNQPAVDLTNGKCVITSQNHGYALDDSQMPKGWSRYYVNANDGSNEGIRHLEKPFRSVQFHPEAKGGPLDTAYLFAEFVDSVRQAKLANVPATLTESADRQAATA